MSMALFAPLLHSSSLDVTEEIVKFEAPCYDTSVLLTALKDTYKEVPVIMGKADDIAESTMSIWTNPTDKSWTIVATKKNLSCVIGTGTHFKIIPIKKSLNL